MPIGKASLPSFVTIQDLKGFWASLRMNNYTKYALYKTHFLRKLLYEVKGWKTRKPFLLPAQRWGDRIQMERKEKIIRPRKFPFTFFYGYWFSLSKLLKERNEREFLFQVPGKMLQKYLLKWSLSKLSQS